MNNIWMIPAIAASSLMLHHFFDAPAWGAVIGGWVFWLTVRPEAKR